MVTICKRIWLYGVVLSQEPLVLSREVLCCNSINYIMECFIIIWSNDFFFLVFHVKIYVYYIELYWFSFGLVSDYLFMVLISL